MPPLFIAEFSDLPDLLVDATDNVEAERAIIAAGVKDTPQRLVAVPPGIFVGELIEIEPAEDESDDEEEEGDLWEVRLFQAFETLLEQRKLIRPLVTPDAVETKPELGDVSDG